MNRIALYLIRFYQGCISPYIPPSCRFTPSCSNYAKEAFMRFGFFKAFYKSAIRILKCNPFHPGGYDPV
jgi:hypothetical protein